ncbi:MAG TPA: hypothetical protein VEX62_02890 [Candidatus Limnocylindrales bacterium]|nr:hypothetical protein [Candidatus Limnocylindrales bacterium]
MFAVVLLLGAMLAGTAASPALAGEPSALTYRPDGWVRYYSARWDGGKSVDPSPWKGDGIYNTTGRYQTAKRVIGGSSLPPGFYLVFEVMIENDGSTDRFRIDASGSDDQWVVKYFRGTTNITSAVEDGTYQTRSLGHGEKLMLKVKVRIDADSPMVRLLTITSVGNPNRVDAVRIKGNFEGCGC